MAAKREADEAETRAPSYDGRSPQLQVAKVLIAHLDGEREALEVAFDDPQATTVSLFWLHREFHGAVSHRVVIPILAELAGRPETVGYIHRVLAQTTDGERLLREQEFREPLEKLVKAPNVPQEAQEIAESLLEMREGRYDWPREWLGPRPAEDENVEEWLKRAKLKHNPFGSEWAELEEYLFDYGTYPSVLEPTHGPLRGKRGPLRGKRPAILFGAPGSGKTATALLLIRDCTSPPPPHGPREKGGAFPVYCKLPLGGVAGGWTRGAYLSFIAKAMGETLMRFLARNPYAFLDQNRSHEAAIASLLIYSAGSLENLIICLERAGLSRESAGQRLLGELKDIGPNANLTFDTNEETWLEVLRCARPFDFKHVYLLVDVVADLTDQQQVAEIAGQLRPLTATELIILLARAGVYLKLFLPEVLEPHLNLRADVVVETIQWTSDELESLMKTRLRRAKRGLVSLDQLLVPPIEDPGRADRLVIEAARGSPRRLIRLGKQLIKQHAGQNPRAVQIASEVLDVVIDSAGIE
jgi:hypothetical protein